MISLITSFSLNKFYLNSLVYHRWCNIFGSSSKVFGNLRKFSEISGKCSGTFVWPSEQFWKIFGNLWKVVGNLRKTIKKAVITDFYIIKRTLQVSSETWILCSSEIWFLPREHKIHIFTPPCNILYLLHIMCGYQCDKAVTKNDTREVI